MAKPCARCMGQLTFCFSIPDTKTSDALQSLTCRTLTVKHAALRACVCTQTSRMWG